MKKTTSRSFEQKMKIIGSPPDDDNNNSRLNPEVVVLFKNIWLIYADLFICLASITLIKVK